MENGPFEIKFNEISKKLSQLSIQQLQQKFRTMGSLKRNVSKIQRMISSIVYFAINEYQNLW
jgi:hypothetical protein